MLPNRHDTHHQLKAQALNIAYSADEHAVYVDAAKCISNTYIACLDTSTPIACRGMPARAMTVSGAPPQPQHPGLAARGSAVSGEKEILVAEQMPSVWTPEAPL